MSHCVILATVDNASRRRGFVVMSTHEEAKLAMISLTRTQIKQVYQFNTSHCISFSDFAGEIRSIYPGLSFNALKVSLP